jgi:hypothetical protein
MWLIVVLFTLLSVIGVATASQAGHAPVLQQARDDALALNMAVYRSLVVQAVSAGAGAGSGSGAGIDSVVSDAALVLPSWYTRDPAWSNELMPDGTIVIYAVGSVSPTFVTELVATSQGSMLVGEARTHLAGDTYLYSPQFGDTAIPLPALPPGTPVWLSPPN